MAGPVPHDIDPLSPAARIIEEEERLLARVEARVALGDDEGGERTVTADYDRELVSLRDAIAEAKPEDLAPLVEQMTRLAAIRARLGGSRALPIDMSSPYFAHMTLREGEKQRDVLIGKRGFIDRASNVQIVDCETPRSRRSTTATRRGTTTRRPSKGASSPGWSRCGAT